MTPHKKASASSPSLSESPGKLSSLNCSSAQLEAWANGVLPAYLPKQRWFRSKTKHIDGARVADGAVLNDQSKRYLLLFLEVHYEDGTAETYFVPFVLEESGRPLVLFDAGDASGLRDALADSGLQRWLFLAARDARTLPTDAGRIVFRSFLREKTEAGPGDFKTLKAEQSNTSFTVQGKFIFKMFRKIEAGINPEVEMLEFLNRRGFAYVPRLKADLRYEAKGQGPSSLGMMQSFIANEGDGWAFVLRSLRRLFSGFREKTSGGPPLSPPIRLLGRRTGQMHVALSAGAAPPDFVPRPLSRKDLETWAAHYRGLLDLAFRDLRSRAGGLSQEVQQRAGAVLGEQAFFEALAEGVLKLEQRSMSLIRYHGDFHLGQVLRTEKDWVLFDFEGEPLRPLSERKLKTCPLKDTAGLLRSLNYAAIVSQADFEKENGTVKGLTELRAAWEKDMRAAFLEGYFEAVKEGTVSFLPDSDRDRDLLLTFFETEKAVYELRYELNTRPEWAGVPLLGLCRLKEGRRP